MTHNPTFTLGKLVRTSGLARASILHYETLGLLWPQSRSPAGYRLYGPAQLERLRRIRQFREAGLSLQAIQQLLPPPLADTDQPPPPTRPSALLEARLVALNEDIARLRTQQMQLAQLLAMPEFREAGTCTSPADWIALLSAAGFSREDRHQWHARFETEQPQAHQQFLQALGLCDAEVARIRRRGLTDSQERGSDRKLS